jgi:hypothetical protein
MPVNIGIIFLVGGLIGWIAVKILKPPKHLRGLIIASCSAGTFSHHWFKLSHILSREVSFGKLVNYYLVLQLEINFE